MNTSISVQDKGDEINKFIDKEFINATRIIKPTDIMKTPINQWLEVIKTKPSLDSDFIFINEKDELGNLTFDLQTLFRLKPDTKLRAGLIMNFLDRFNSSVSNGFMMLLLLLTESPLNSLVILYACKRLKGDRFTSRTLIDLFTLPHNYSDNRLSDIYEKGKYEQYNYFHSSYAFEVGWKKL